MTVKQQSSSACIQVWWDGSEGVEEHVGALGEALVAPQRLEHVVLGLGDLVVVEDEPLAAGPDVGHVVPVVLAGAQVHHCAHQLVEQLGGLLLPVGPHLQLVAEGGLPVELHDAPPGLVVHEPPQVHGQEVGEGLDEGALLGLDQLVAGVALELVTARQSLRLAVVADGVVEGDVGLGQHEAEVHLLLLPLGDGPAGQAGGAGDAFGEELLLEGSALPLGLGLDLVVDLVHEPDVELVAVLVALPLEHRRLLLHELHQPAGRHRLELLPPLHALQQFPQLLQDAPALPASPLPYSDFPTMSLNTGWCSSTCRIEFAQHSVSGLFSNPTSSWFSRPAFSRLSGLFPIICQTPSHPPFQMNLDPQPEQPPQPERPVPAQGQEEPVGGQQLKQEKEFRKNLSIPTVMALPFLALNYYDALFTLLYLVMGVGLLVYKQRTLPLPDYALTCEGIMYAMVGLTQLLKGVLARRGVTDKTATSVLMYLVGTGFLLLTYVFMLRLQTYVILAEVVTNATAIGLAVLQLAVGGWLFKVLLHKKQTN